MLRSARPNLILSHMASFTEMPTVDDSVPRTNALAFAKVDCYTCQELRRHCDRRRPRCGTCLSSRQRCGGFAMDLVWKDVSVVTSDVPRSQKVDSKSQLQHDQSYQLYTGLKFVQGRPKRKRKQKGPLRSRKNHSSSVLDSQFHLVVVSSSPDTDDVSNFGTRLSATTAQYETGLSGDLSSGQYPEFTPCHHFRNLTIRLRQIHNRGLSLIKVGTKLG